MQKIKEFIESHVFKGLLLLVWTILALVVANSPLNPAYLHFMEIPFSLGVGSMHVELTMHEFVNDFLMAIFFVVVGIEIKRELLYGQLKNPKSAAFPLVGAIGGMVLPAIIFTAFNYGMPTQVGVGIPLATDIAFALSVIIILKKYISPQLKVFLLSLAIVDDLLSIIILAVFYSGGVNFKILLVALLLFGYGMYLNKVKKHSGTLSYIFIAFLIWLCFFEAHIHPSLAGIILAIMLPSDVKYYATKESIMEHMEHRLDRFTSYFVLPLFAFVNVGIVFGEGVVVDLVHSSALSLGIIAGLVVGKPLGVFIFTFIAEKINIARRPRKTRWLEIISMGMFAGIGFTMSLFMIKISLDEIPDFINVAKSSVLVASVLATVLGTISTITLYRLKMKRNKE